MCGIFALSLGHSLQSWRSLRPAFRINISVFDTIIDVAKDQRVTRRRLHNTVRKTILAYFSQEEAALVVKAAKKQKMTISNFVASAALKEAEVINYLPGKRQ